MTLCADSRDTAFAELKKRGIMSIIHIAPATRNIESSRRSTGRGPKGVWYAALVVSLSAVCGVWFFLPRERNAGTGEAGSNSNKKASYVKPPRFSPPITRPPKGATYGESLQVSTQSVETLPPSAPVAKASAWIPPPEPPGMDEQARSVWLRKMRYERRKATDGRLKNFLENCKTEPAMYRTGTEQLLDWVFFTKVGDIPPPPLPPIPPAELSRIGEILDTVNEPGDDDDETVAERKKIVDNAKTVLKEYLAEGGTVQDFLDHYLNELTLAHQKKDVASVAIQEVIRFGDATQAVLFIEEVNRQLEQEGINPVELTDVQKEELADGVTKP